MVTSALRSAVLFLSDRVPMYVPPGSESALGEKDLDTQSEPESIKSKHEKYIWEIHESIRQLGLVHVPDPDSIPHNKLFRVVRFGPAEFLNVMPDRQLHPAPIPELLQQRNMNVLVNLWYKKGLVPLAALTPGVAAAFWPSCLDLDATGNTCNLCRCVRIETPAR